LSSEYEIDLAEPAEHVYRKLYQQAQACIRAGRVSNAKVTLFRMVEDAIDNIIPHNPASPDRALSGALSNIFRVKKGRIRICYICSSKQKRIVVLFISEHPRKAGHRSDPYATFTRLLHSGEYDKLFEALGVRPRRHFR